MKTYIGTRTDQGCAVTVNGKPLKPRCDLWNHSPTGFEWGYGGSGPAQLALAILADHFANEPAGDTSASNLHQPFKRAVVAALDKDGWTLTSEQIDRALAVIAAERKLI